MTTLESKPVALTRRFQTREDCAPTCETRNAIPRPLSRSFVRAGLSATRPRTERRHRGEDLATHDLEGLHPVNPHDPAEDRLDAHPCEPGQLAEQLGEPRRVADVEKEGRCLFDGVVVAVCALAKPLEKLELARDVGDGRRLHASP